MNKFFPNFFNTNSVSDFPLGNNTLIFFPKNKWLLPGGLLSNQSQILSLLLRFITNSSSNFGFRGAGRTGRIAEPGARKVVEKSLGGEQVEGRQAVREGRWKSPEEGEKLLPSWLEKQSGRTGQ